MNFPYLGMTKTQLEYIFDQHKENCKKIVFKFQFDDVTAPSLVAYGAKTIKRFLSIIPQETLQKLPISNTISGEIYLGNLELRDDQYEILKKDSGYANASHLIFEPMESTDFPKSVVYKVGWGTIENFLPFVPIVECNPSPPKEPHE